MMISERDLGGGAPIYQQRQQDRLDAAANAAAPAAPATPETPVDSPGPAADPQADQGGPPAGRPQPQPTPQVPPAIASAVEGIQGSQATGGVQGSFDQAGTRGFAQKFGGENPAVWFRNFASKGAGAVPAGIGKQITGDRGAMVRGGSQAGGAVPSESAIPVGATTGGEGGGKQDEDWQRFMQAVVQQRFGRG